MRAFHAILSMNERVRERENRLAVRESGETESGAHMLFCGDSDGW